LGENSKQEECRTDESEKTVITAWPPISQIKRDRDRKMVQMWGEGLEAPDIAGRLQNITPKRIQNHIVELRNIYGPDQIPYHRGQPAKSG
jgi:hypothetical protein